MKYYRFLLALLFLPVVFFSCTSEHEDMLIGTWRFANIEDQITNKDAPMSPDDVNNMKNIASYTFKKNKTYILDLGAHKDNGMWYVSENGTALNMRSEVSNAPGRATINKLTDNELVLVIQVSTGHMQKLSLYKI